MQKASEYLSNYGYSNLFLKSIKRVIFDGILDLIKTMMNKFFLLIGLLLFAAPGAFAGHSFLIKDASKTFDVKIEIDRCEDDVCDDKATVSLTKKNQTQIFQKFEMAEMYLRFDTGKTLNGGTIELGRDEYYGVSFADFNFDGTEDLEIANGLYAPYGGASSDVFLFSKAAGKFAKHAGLSDLASENMSVEINKKGRYIETFTKSGCCWHQTARYKFAGNRLIKIYVFTEDGAVGGGKVRLTTETRVGKRCKKTTKVALIKDYYKEQ
jgi:hypothetical protein